MSVELTKESRDRGIASIKRHFAETWEQRIGNIAAGALLGFFLEEMGPTVYNQAVADMRQRLQARVLELHIEVHEDEFRMGPGKPRLTSRDIEVAARSRPRRPWQGRSQLHRRGFVVSSFLRFDGATTHQAQIEDWFDDRPPELADIARDWFAEMRSCGPDVTELLHDGHPTACVEDAAFGYVNLFTSHVNIGFFQGANLPDPAQILQGTGRFMRHVKARPGSLPDRVSLKALVRAAYSDIKARLAAEAQAQVPKRPSRSHRPS